MSGVAPAWPRVRRTRSLVAAGVAVACMAGTVHADWSHTGASSGGDRYSPHAQIDRNNVARLEVAWRYSTGELERRGDAPITNSSTQVTPVLFEDSLLFCTPFDRIIALDAATGEERWVHDPEVDGSHTLPFQYNCRGVAVWTDPELSGDAPCRDRVLTGTSDMRLVAVDARSGERCEEFGEGGEVAIPHGELAFPGEVKTPSAPVVLNGVVVVGTSIMDNLHTQAPDGTVHGFDARTGELRWHFEPIPRDPSDPAWETWHDDSAPDSGAGNVWAPMVVDETRDLVFLPVSSAAPDFWGGARPGRNLYTGSLVALDGSSGEVRWYFQHVHHDLWDYDTPSPPMLVELGRDGATVPAVVQTTKQGFVFVLHRETGEPLFPVEHRPVPQSAEPGEWVSPTQPFPVLPEPLLPLEVTPDDAWGFTFFDRRACRQRIEGLHHEGIFTPPRTEPGTLMNPGTAGGMNWGGPAWDPARRLAIVNFTNVPQVVTLLPREEVGDVEGITLVEGRDVAAMVGAPYAVSRDWLLSPLGAPCVAPPWGELAAIDLDTGEIAWRRPLGSIREQVPALLRWTRRDWELGTPNLGGPVVTAGGLVFIAATMDRKLRAFDIDSGETLWQHTLDAGTQTTPMTYMAGGRQFVAIATGHHLWFGTPKGDEIIVFALPED